MSWSVNSVYKDSRIRRVYTSASDVQNKNRKRLGKRERSELWEVYNKLSIKQCYYQEWVDTKGDVLIEYLPEKRSKEGIVCDSEQEEHSYRHNLHINRIEIQYNGSQKCTTSIYICMYWSQYSHKKVNSQIQTKLFDVIFTTKEQTLHKIKTKGTFSQSFKPKSKEISLQIL